MELFEFIGEIDLEKKGLLKHNSELAIENRESPSKQDSHVRDEDEVNKGEMEKHACHLLWEYSDRDPGKNNWRIMGRNKAEGKSLSA